MTTLSSDTASRSRGVICPRFAMNFLTLQSEGAGNTGCTLHPRSRVQVAQKNAHEHTGSAEAIRHSLRNGFTLIPCSPRRPGFFATVVRAPERELDASVAASGPHVFAVRLGAVRLTALRRPSHPRPASVTTANRPSEWDGMARDIEVIWVRRQVIFSEKQKSFFFAKGLDTPHKGELICPVG
jgi:hypothetical protein